MDTLEYERYKKNENEKLRLRKIEYGFNCLKILVAKDYYVKELSKPKFLIYVVHYIGQLENIISKIESENELLKYILFLLNNDNQNDQI